MAWGRRGSRRPHAIAGCDDGVDGTEAPPRLRHGRDVQRRRSRLPFPALPAFECFCFLDCMPPRSCDFLCSSNKQLRPVRLPPSRACHLLRPSDLGPVVCPDVDHGDAPAVRPSLEPAETPHHASLRVVGPATIARSSNAHSIRHSRS